MGAALNSGSNAFSGLGSSGGKSMGGGAQIGMPGGPQFNPGGQQNNVSFNGQDYASSIKLPTGGYGTFVGTDNTGQAIYDTAGPLRSASFGRDEYVDANGNSLGFGSSTNTPASYNVANRYTGPAIANPGFIEQMNNLSSGGKGGRFGPAQPSGPQIGLPVERPGQGQLVGGPAGKPIFGTWGSPEVNNPGSVGESALNAPPTPGQGQTPQDRYNQYTKNIFGGGDSIYQPNFTPQGQLVGGPAGKPIFGQGPDFIWSGPANRLPEEAFGPDGKLSPDFLNARNPFGPAQPAPQPQPVNRFAPPNAPGVRTQPRVSAVNQANPRNISNRYTRTRAR